MAARWIVSSIVVVCALAPRADATVIARLADESRANNATASALASPTSETGDSLLSALLLAGGTSPREVAGYEQRFAAHVARLRATGTVAGDARTRAAAIHDYLHRHILTGQYATGGPPLADALGGESFDCATASALFVLLARAFDLPACAVSVAGHVWCRISPDLLDLSGPFDLETTCRRWFDITDTANDDPAASRILAEHRQRQARARWLDDRRLLAVMHYNRGVRLLGERDEVAAARSNLVALALDPQLTAARDNLLAAINNHAVSLAAEGDSRRALACLMIARWLAPGYEPFAINARFFASTARNSSAQ